MKYTKVKILNGKHLSNKQTLELEVDILNGEPGKGDFIFLKEHYYSAFPYEIQKVQKKGNATLLTIAFPEQDWMWNDRILPHITDEDPTALCGINLEALYSLSVEDKIAYFTGLISGSTSDRLKAYIESNATSAVKLIPKEFEGEEGLSKLGGLPVAPEGFTFPVDENGQSMLFIGQVHIGELNQWFSTTRAFNGEGVLYFFSSVKEEDDCSFMGNTRVLYTDDIDQVSEVALPDDLADYGTFPEQDLMVAETLHIPPGESTLWPEPEMTDEERDDYQYFESIVNLYNQLGDTQLLGHPNQIQGCVLLEAELMKQELLWYSPSRQWDQEQAAQTIKEIAPACRDWKLLFEFDSDSFTELSNFSEEFNEYMDGMFYLLIKTEDLEAMNFDKVLSIYQST